ncbi:serine-rich adhesin for platelets-like [Ptychodera flava]|uniref:serine-rich adhesin for platelets-like n=1 Tax=Ptychodera flava TaxID=63121 RepID=UPI00396A00F3
MSCFPLTRRLTVVLLIVLALQGKTANRLDKRSPGIPKLPPGNTTSEESGSGEFTTLFASTTLEDETASTIPDDGTTDGPLTSADATTIPYGKSTLVPSTTALEVSSTGKREPTGIRETEAYTRTSKSYPGTSKSYPGTSKTYPGTSKTYPGTSKTYPGTSKTSSGTSETSPETSVTMKASPKPSASDPLQSTSISTTVKMSTETSSSTGTTVPPVSTTRSPFYGTIPEDEEPTFSSPPEKIYQYSMRLDVDMADYVNMDDFIDDFNETVCAEYRELAVDDYLGCDIAVVEQTEVFAMRVRRTEKIEDVSVEYDIKFLAESDIAESGAEELYTETGISDKIADETLSEKFVVTEEPCTGSGSQRCEALPVNWCQYANCDSPGMQPTNTSDSCVCQSSCKHGFCSVHENALCEHTKEGELICWCPSNHESYGYVKCEATMHRIIFITLFCVCIAAVIIIFILLCLWCNQKSETKKALTEHNSSVLDPNEREDDVQSLEDTWIKTIRSRDFDDIWSEAYEQGWDSLTHRPPSSVSGTSTTKKKDGSTSKKAKKSGDEKSTKDGGKKKKKSQDEEDWRTYYPYGMTDRDRDIGMNFYSNQRDTGQDMFEYGSSRPTSGLYESLPEHTMSDNFYRL